MLSSSSPPRGAALYSCKNEASPSIRCSPRVTVTSSSAKSILHSSGSHASSEKSGVRKAEASVPRGERKKIIALCLMFFCILFAYGVLRDTKDALVVAAKGSNAEIIPFLKTWVNLPVAIGFTVVYTKLSNVLSREALFYACVLSFVGIFGSFAFVLYPLRGILHTTALADDLLSGPIALFRNWAFVLFYVMAELWGSVVVSVLFWGFANQITSLDEAKRFYPLFGLAANVALVFAERTVKFFAELRGRLGPDIDGWGFSLKGMMSIVVMLGFTICTIYWWMNAYVVNDRNLPRKKKIKATTSVGESVKLLVKSRYILDLATLVIAYEISINLSESHVGYYIAYTLLPQLPNSTFLEDFSTWIGIMSLSMTLLSRLIFNNFGWGVLAAIISIVIPGITFLSLALSNGSETPFVRGIGVTVAVYVGIVQHIVKKNAKYSLFDPCKEMTHIPLDEDTKVKSKAIVDIICNPLGAALVLMLGPLSTPYVCMVLLVIMLAWLRAARSLDKQF
ncbi:hypothetical protein SELMODRAFT_116019, partial [Selaginella moellendorffii]